jgi:hypothetical protein
MPVSTNAETMTNRPIGMPMVVTPVPSGVPAPQMRCEQTTTERVVDGQVRTTRTWNFSVRKA